MWVNGVCVWWSWQCGVSLPLTQWRLPPTTLIWWMNRWCKTCILRTIQGLFAHEINEKTNKQTNKNDTFRSWMSSGLSLHDLLLDGYCAVFRKQLTCLTCFMCSMSCFTLAVVYGQGGEVSGRRMGGFRLQGYVVWMTWLFPSDVVLLPGQHELIWVRGTLVEYKYGMDDVGCVLIVSALI